MRVSWDETGGLNKNTKRAAQFGQVGGRDHAADGIEVFVGQACSVCVDFETEEDA